MPVTSLCDPKVVPGCPTRPAEIVDLNLLRQARGQRADRRGREAENLAADALATDGWEVLARRLRTPAGEIDLVAERDGIVAFVEVKGRPTLSQAAYALDLRQRRRLGAAAEIALAEHPTWGRHGARFDVMLVDGAGRVRRVAGAFDLDAA